MKIGTRDVGPGHPVFIIAEIGSNHGGSLERALALIDAAADAGADAAKFQYFRVDRFIVPRENPEALRRYELPDEWLVDLWSRCSRHGIEFLCTAFDLESLGVVDPFVNAHKVGSYETAVPAFIDAVAAKRKPVITSHGIKKSSPWPWLDGTMSSITLACVSAYPAPIEGYLASLNRPYGGKWGVSDHTLHPTIIPAAAVALGACVVEKHMRAGESIVERDDPDYSVSVTAGALKMMVQTIRLTESAVRG